MEQKEREALLRTMRTAFLTAYPKIFTNVPYAHEIFFQATKLAAGYGFSFQPSLFTSDMAVELEARHKSLSVALAKNVVKNTLVIEFGVGLSSRRMEFPNVQYVEVDYPLIVEVKKNIYKELQVSPYEKGLHAVDLSDAQALRAFLQGIPNLKTYDKIIVLSEGLFWYLKRKQVEDILAELSVAFNGLRWIWLTADCPAPTVSTASYRNVIANSSDRSPIEPFADYEDFHAFFQENGFDVKRFKMEEWVAPKDIYAGAFFSIPEEEILSRMRSYTDIAIFSKTNE